MQESINIRMENLLEALDESQRSAVEYCDGPSMVIAGAGSGKTRVLTYKIAYLLQRGYEPWSILALTFTNKAAREMKDRIGDLVGMNAARYINMGTFHSVFSHILRREAQTIGYQSNFTIYDTKDSQSLAKAIIKDMQLDEKKYVASAIHSNISMAKNRLILAETYAQDAEMQERDKRSNTTETSKIYRTYQERLKQANAMDFDDLLINTFLLFQQHPNIRKAYAERYKYVLVDEYQDTNSVQQQIVLLLTKENQHICVVGDDYQSIYAFRGAQIDNILNFQKVYDDVRLFKMERNYRSTPEIVNAANSLMKHNQYQIEKDVFSNNQSGEKVIYRQLYSDREEAAVVAKMIRSIKKSDNCNFSDFAILYRTNSQSRTFEEEFRNHAMPYRVVGSTEFFQRKEIKDVIAYFRVIVNPADEEALKRIINYPTRGIGATTLQKIVHCATTNRVSLWAVLNALSTYDISINRGTEAKLLAFVQLIKSFASNMDKDAFELAQLVVAESGIMADLSKSQDVESISRQENVQELLGSISEFVESKREEGEEEHVYIEDFLQQVALETDKSENDEDEDRINLMTIHAAKGLEFNTVFVVGLEEKIFPSMRSANSLRELEEERRLLYVAITRARVHCILTSARNRWLYSQMEVSMPSRFIQDISSQYLNVISNSMMGSDGFSESGQNYRANGNKENRTYGLSNKSNGYRQNSSRWQNSHPVASQFMADLKEKQTAPRRPERAVDAFSPQFKSAYVANGGKLTKLSKAMTNGGRAVPASVSASASSQIGNLKEGSVIEHQRFGIGKVIKIEGTGENTKATVVFEHTGEKQLLLKFARFTIKG